MDHRTLKRVPLDFDWPLRKTWEGYIDPDEVDTWCHFCKRGYVQIKSKKTGLNLKKRCPICKGTGEFPHPYGWKKYEPPLGDGWQLWETCGVGSPISPVFSTPEKLAKWCSKNATIFADDKLSKKEWLRLFLIEDGVERASMQIYIVGNEQPIKVKTV